jgi:hypothetical protein
MMPMLVAKLIKIHNIHEFHNHSITHNIREFHNHSIIHETKITPYPTLHFLRKSALKFRIFYCLTVCFLLGRLKRWKEQVSILWPNTLSFGKPPVNRQRSFYLGIESDEMWPVINPWDKNYTLPHITFFTEICIEVSNYMLCPLNRSTYKLWKNIL